MRRRLFFARLALVLLVALPLRSMAAIEWVAAGSVQFETPMAEDSMPGDCGASHEASNDDTTHAGHGTCNVCCCAAVIATREFRWSARRDPPTLPLPLVVLAAPAVIVDGLERPPRSSLV